jgi:thiosulfate/3-mercaptopyruvate sulfurtransferase
MKTLVSTSEVAQHLRDPRVVIVDVRHDLAQPENWGLDRYREAHVPGAQFVHIDRDLSAPKTGQNGRHPLLSPDAAAALFSRLGIDESKQVLVYDQNGGMFASRLWWMLRWLGHESVALMDGGFDRWMREQRPVTAEIAGFTPATFIARPEAGTVDTEAVAEGLDTRAHTLLDARAPERYRGELEPFDPVAGHIPGALNRFYGNNLTAEGTFKPAETLRREFAQLLGETPLDDVVHYCGSGVTACHNLLAMEVAGLPGTRIYPGSWSEWCALHPTLNGVPARTA